MTLWAIVAIVAASPAMAAGLDIGQVQAFVARQERAWNDRALETYFAAFQPGAVFTDQYRTPSQEIVPYGHSSLAQARVQARRSLAGSRVSEHGEVRDIAIARDGRSARVLSMEVSRIETAGKIRVVCAERAQTLVLAQDRLLSAGQTDTVIRCPR